VLILHVDSGHLNRTVGLLVGKDKRQALSFLAELYFHFVSSLVERVEQGEANLKLFKFVLDVDVDSASLQILCVILESLRLVVDALLQSLRNTDAVDAGLPVRRDSIFSKHSVLVEEAGRIGDERLLANPDVSLGPLEHVLVLLPLAKLRGVADDADFLAGNGLVVDFEPDLVSLGTSSLGLEEAGLR